MQTYTCRAGSYRRHWNRIASLCFYCGGLFLPHPAWGQTSAPSKQAPIAPANATQPPLPDPFYNALDQLSKKFKIAIIAESRPFPQSKSTIAPAPGADAPHDADEQPNKAETTSQETPQEDAAQAGNPGEAVPPTEGLSSEEAVRAVAERFDYTAVHQGSVYLLLKRYTNPEDMPEVTPEECLIGLKRLPIPSSAPPGNALAKNADLYGPATIIRQTSERLSGRSAFARTGTMNDLMYSQALNILANDFYFHSRGTRKAVTIALLENGRPQDPVLRWKTIAKLPVFGYETVFGPEASPVFLPVSDCERILVPPYGTTIPYPVFSMRYAPTLPDPDPTDPAKLPQAVKRFLDDNGRSSRAVTIAEVVAGLNKREKSRLIYKVDPAYASKHITIAGIDTLSPETVMQAMAAVYGLGVDHRRDNTVVMTDPPGFIPPPPPAQSFIFTLYREFDKFLLPSFPAPIYRALHARFLAGRTRTRNQEGPRLLEYKTQYEFQDIATAFRNSAMQMFRYLAETQVKARPDQKLELSRLGERARTLFALARTASAYADACELVDIPLPPYVTHIDDFRQNVQIRENVYRDANGALRLALALMYLNPQSGVAYGPVPFFDAPMN